MKNSRLPAVERAMLLAASQVKRSEKESHPLPLRPRKQAEAEGQVLPGVAAVQGHALALEVVPDLDPAQDPALAPDRDQDQDRKRDQDRNLSLDLVQDQSLDPDHRLQIKAAPLPDPVLQARLEHRAGIHVAAVGHQSLARVHQVHGGLHDRNLGAVVRGLPHRPVLIKCS